jgi:large subunit ribosomal protein L33
LGVACELPTTSYELESVMRDIVHLACGDCKRRNYSTTKNKKKTTERIEFSKFCRFCRKHTAHKETK